MCANFVIGFFLLCVPFKVLQRIIFFRREEGSEASKKTFHTGSDISVTILPKYHMKSTTNKQRLKLLQANSQKRSKTDFEVQDVDKGEVVERKGLDDVGLE